MESNKFVETVYELIKSYSKTYLRAEDNEHGCREVLKDIKDDFFAMNYVVLSEPEVYNRKRYITGGNESADIIDGIDAFDRNNEQGASKAVCVQSFIDEARLAVYRLVTSEELTENDDGK